MWTGAHYYGTELDEPSKKYQLEVFDSNESLHKYRINFIDPVKCQDLIKFKLVTNVADTNKTMQPISSYMVKHQIDLLILKVVTPKNLIKNVKKSIYYDFYRQMQIGKSACIPKKTVGDYDFYEIQIENPTLLYRYFIEWEFTN